jgi:hypothetical protein
MLCIAPMNGNHFVILFFQEINHDIQEVFAHDELASVSHLIMSSFFLAAKIIIPL